MVLTTIVGLPLIRLVGLAEIKQGLNEMLNSPLSLEVASAGCPERVGVSRGWALLPDLLLPAVRNFILPVCITADHQSSLNSPCKGFSYCLMSLSQLLGPGDWVSLLPL